MLELAYFTSSQLMLQQLRLGVSNTGAQVLGTRHFTVEFRGVRGGFMWSHIEGYSRTVVDGGHSAATPVQVVPEFESSLVHSKLVRSLSEYRPSSKTNAYDFTSVAQHQSIVVGNQDR